MRVKFATNGYILDHKGNVKMRYLVGEKDIPEELEDLVEKFAKSKPRQCVVLDREEAPIVPDAPEVPGEVVEVLEGDGQSVLERVVAWCDAKDEKVAKAETLQEKLFELTRNEQFELCESFEGLSKPHHAAGEAKIVKHIMDDLSVNFVENV